jgi:integrase
VPIDRASFEARIDRTSDHHLWMGAKTERGFGQVRVDGRLRTAAQVAWELDFGPLPPGQRVVACPEHPSCVRVSHLSMAQRAASRPKARSARGGGSMTEIAPGTWKIGVSAGLGDDGERVRTFRTIRGTKKDAAKALAALVVEVGDGRGLPTRDSKLLTVNDLVEWYLDFARDERGLDHSTLTGYADVYNSWLRDSLGHLKAVRVGHAELDKAFGRMRRAGLSRSRMNNARALLSGAYKWGKRHRKVAANPVDGFELPSSTRVPRPTNAPEVDDLLRLLDGADEHDPDLAPVLKLGTTTGMRRGELAGLRRNRLRLDQRELTVDSAVNDAGGTVVEKSTKTKRNRTISLDDATVALLRGHLSAMDRRAAEFGPSVAVDGFVFTSTRRALRRCGPSS